MAHVQTLKRTPAETKAYKEGVSAAHNDTVDETRYQTDQWYRQGAINKGTRMAVITHLDSKKHEI